MIKMDTAMQGRNQNCGTCPVACIKTPSSSKNTAWIVYRRQPTVRLGRKNKYKRQASQSASAVYRRGSVAQNFRFHQMVSPM